MANRICKYAANPSGDVWECSCYVTMHCEEQEYDINPYDDKINVVTCRLLKGEQNESGRKKRPRKTKADVSADPDTL